MRSILGRVSWSSFGWSLRLVGKHLSLGLSYRLIQQNIICVENEFGVVREWHFCQPVHEHDEEQGTEYGALGDSRGNLAGGRCERVDDSALLSVREVALKPPSFTV